MTLYGLGVVPISTACGDSSECELAGERVNDTVDTLSTLCTVFVLPALSFFFLRLFVFVLRLFAVLVLVAMATADVTSSRFEMLLPS